MAHIIMEVWVRDAAGEAAFECVCAGPEGDAARAALKQAHPHAELSWMLASESWFDALNYCSSALQGRAHESADADECAPHPDAWAHAQREWFVARGASCPPALLQASTAQ